MPELVSIALACSNCGAGLEITPDIDRFTCLHCGSQQIVRRGGGIISLQPLVQGIERVQIGTDKTAAELAIQRLSKEIAEVREILVKVDRMMPEDVVPPPGGNYVPPELIWIVGGGIFVACLSMGAILIGAILSVISVVVGLILTQRAQNTRREQWLAEVEATKNDVVEAQMQRLARLQGKLEVNRRIANS